MHCSDFSLEEERGREGARHTAGEMWRGEAPSRGARWETRQKAAAGEATQSWEGRLWLGEGQPHCLPSPWSASPVFCSLGKSRCHHSQEGLQQVLTRGAHLCSPAPSFAGVGCGQVLRVWPMSSEGRCEQREHFWE